MGDPGVNPTYVGMDRKYSLLASNTLGKPHVCGDGPTAVQYRGIENP